LHETRIRNVKSHAEVNEPLGTRRQRTQRLSGGKLAVVALKIILLNCGVIIGYGDAGAPEFGPLRIGTTAIVGKFAWRAVVGLVQ